VTVTPIANLLRPYEIDEAITVLCDAFRDYPVMRYVLGTAGDYERRLRTLVGFFVSARVFREEPVLGSRDETGTLVAAAIVTLPGERVPPEPLAVRREEVWAELGPAERARYDTYGAACAPFAVQQPHHHLNMIGVRRSHAGRGFGGRLLDAVHRMAADDEGSFGVSLTTEARQNLAFYEQFGYRIIGYARVPRAFETWTFFRPSDGPGTRDHRST
jgi:GNAT superfamily N-acetyltransferase